MSESGVHGSTLDNVSDSLVSSGCGAKVYTMRYQFSNAFFDRNHLVESRIVSLRRCAQMTDRVS